MIKPHVFLHFSPIPHSPDSPQIPSSHLILPKKIFIDIFFNVVFTLFGFFSCGSPTRRSRKKREMVMDVEQAYEINFIFRLACDFITCVGYCAAEIFCGNLFCGLAFLLFVLSCFIFSFFFSTKMIKKSPFYEICKFWFLIFPSFLSVLVCFVFSLNDIFSYFLMEKNFSVGYDWNLCS